MPDEIDKLASEAIALAVTVQAEEFRREDANTLANAIIAIAGAIKRLNRKIDDLGYEQTIAHGIG